MHERLLEYPSKLRFNISKTKLEIKIKSFNDEFLLVLIEKVRRNVIMLPYWIIKKYVKKAKTRKNYDKLYYCTVNRDDSITFGGVRIKENIVRRYIVQYEMDPLTEEELRNTFMEEKLEELRKFPLQVCIYIIVAGILNSSLWFLIDYYLTFLNMEIFIKICLLCASFVALILYYLYLIKNQKRN